MTTASRRALLAGASTAFPLAAVAGGPTTVSEADTELLRLAAELRAAEETGGCLCGVVRYVAEGAPVNQRVCHCRLCQKALGAAFNARLLFRDADVRLSGPAGRFRSSPALERGFCRDCGTTIFSARRGAGLIGLTAGSLDDPGQFRPDMHFWTSSRQPWLRLDDGLPQHPEAPPS